MTKGSRGPAPAASLEVTRYQAVRRLTRAAAESETQLIAEVAALVQGWAVLVDLTGGVICSTPHTAGPEGVRAAAHPQVYTHLTIRKMAGAVLVVAPGETVRTSRAELIARATVDLLRMRARSRLAEEAVHAEQRLHTAVLRLLMNGQPHLAKDVMGGPPVTHATVFRLAGQAVHDAYQAYWREAQPSVTLGEPRILVCVEGSELVIAALHGISDGRNSARQLVTRLADRYQLAGGASDPLPLDIAATAWAEAGTARHGARAGHLASATFLGSRGLLGVVPAHRLASWGGAILDPLDRAQRRTLEAYLRSGSAQAAASVLDVSEGTLRTRLRRIGTLLGAELDDSTVHAQLLLAVRAPAAPNQIQSSARLDPGVPLPTDLLSPESARRWASTLLTPLDRPLRIALRCWLQHRGRTAPAASELGLSRSTLADWLNRCAGALSLDLSSATVRAELHLAAETIATPDDAPALLPRRGGRTFRG
ncbi:helix-turn-helix domain-containing protein [Streptomyces chartreusis]|uniref:Helix-turn-helix domain-containing protein n=1 Tax=Streptomyces chartreusis TaxID=1969 RepID=A0A7H8TK52_STRCX|nr:helix-turn-helix domain-containing protein [Streptomyces chartreusis]QKZ23903.1 helix-turn-helix domain-containing protein [Streptomyces chartreusis]